jgi:hypothetical protein
VTLYTLFLPGGFAISPSLVYLLHSSSKVPVGITTGDTRCARRYAITSIHEACSSIEVLLYSINTVRCSLVLR